MLTFSDAPPPPSGCLPPHSPPMYLSPPSHNTVTIVLPGGSRSATRSTPTQFMPDEPPTKSPSSASSRRAMATASSSVTRKAASIWAQPKLAVRRSRPTPSMRVGGEGACSSAREARPGWEGRMRDRASDVCQGSGGRMPPFPPPTCAAVPSSPAAPCCTAPRAAPGGTRPSPEGRPETRAAQGFGRGAAATRPPAFRLFRHPSQRRRPGRRLGAKSRRRCRTRAHAWRGRVRAGGLTGGCGRGAVPTYAIRKAPTPAPSSPTSLCG
eukprot:scaffold7348_cov113-Isochrysis_galbana.AAC.3